MKSCRIILWLIPLFWVSCQRKEVRMVRYVGFTQGSTFQVKFYAGRDSLDIIRGIDSIFKEIDKTASVYDTNSITSKVNNNRKVNLNRHFIKLFTKSQEISQATDGYFDITVAPLVKAWGFWKKKGIDLTPLQIDSLLQFVGYKKVRLIVTGTDTNVYKENPNIMLDFNAIAQGYTVDVIAEYLLKKKYHHFLIEIGGEVRASGMKENNEPWVIGIEKPAASDTSSQIIQERLVLRNKSLATSGNYRKYFIKDGVKYSHTINPHSGEPVSHSLLSVTVLSDDCTSADAYATAFMVMGLEKAKSFLTKHPEWQAYFIYSDSNGKNAVYHTPNFFEK